MSALSSFRRRLMVGAYPKEQPNYLCFTALESGTFTLTIGANLTTSNFSFVEYSLDGNTWVKTNNVNSSTVTVTTPTVNAGDKVYWRGVGVRNCQTRDTNSNNKGIFSSTCEFNASGCIASYLFYKKTDEVSLTYDRSFVGLFSGCSKLVDASELILPENLSNDCFAYTFRNCSALEYGPSIPSGEMKQYCFNGSFYGCTSLKGTGELNSNQLAQYCYAYMYQNCTSLTSTPNLPATTLYEGCYNDMFAGCTSVTTVGDMPATIIPKNAYFNMFSKCNITSTPTIIVTSIGENGCRSMFSSCSNLITNNISLPATTLAKNCYNWMFYQCKKITSAPELPALTLVEGCYNSMFHTNNKVNYIKMLATDISASNALGNWVVSVASSGIFVKHINAQWTTTGWAGVPTNWTVIYYDPAVDKYYTDQTRATECDDHGNPI